MKKPGKASVGDIARAAKLSRTAVAFALQNRPGVSAATRQRVQRIAKRLGYSPDARITSWMARVREAKVKDFLPIAWLNTNSSEDTWTKFKFHTPYLEGARESCRDLGYHLDEIWTGQPGMTMRRISQILYQRHIQGVIVTYGARHLRLNWENLAAVALGGSLLAPRIHRVMNDSNFNLLLALKALRRTGYRRIGICLANQVDQFSQRVLHSTAQHFSMMTPESNRVPPLFYRGENDAMIHEAERQFTTWIHRYRPEVVLGSSNLLLKWTKAAGLTVPKDVGIVHLAKDDDVLDWAGIHSNKKEMGATAAEWVISLVQNHRFGVPRVGLDMLVRGTWSAGWTLPPRKPTKYSQATC
jgi:LacI family transcriptional regulator